jgi:hypothetical protein
MAGTPKSTPRALDTHWAASWLSRSLLVFPAVINGWAAITNRGEFRWIHAAAAVPLGLAGLGITRTMVVRRDLGYWQALIWAAGAVAFWLGSPRLNDMASQTVLGGMVLIAVSLHSGTILRATGALQLRRARYLVRQFMRRRDWPEDLDACRQIPEVRALREATRDEAGPVMPLLRHHLPSVRIAGLAALEFRRSWRTGQPEVVLELAKNDPVPEVRAAALLALGGIQQRLIIEEMATCLDDRSPIVRQAAIDALLWDCDNRWIWVRHAVHAALGNPATSRDGPLQLTFGRFSEAATSDLIAWSTEAGTLGLRATQTLARHYSQQLSERDDPQLFAHVIDLVLSPRTAAILRIELAEILRQHGRLTNDALELLLDPANPSSLRLLAVESLLQHGPHSQAIDSLRDIARHPNRELALQAALIVQRYLHVDMGLAIDQPLPQLHTRQAADVTRRVIQWAEQRANSPSRGSSHQQRPTGSGSRLASHSSALAQSPSRLSPSAELSDHDKKAPWEWD